MTEVNAFSAVENGVLATRYREIFLYGKLMIFTGGDVDIEPLLKTPKFTSVKTLQMSILLLVPAEKHGS